MGTYDKGILILMIRMMAMAQGNDWFRIIIKKGKKRIAATAPLADIHKLIFIINHQFTNAPNTTQIASGAGRSSAAGNNAAIKSPNTRQQQSVGAGGKARNKGDIGNSPLRYAHSRLSRRYYGKEVVVVINDQIVRLPKRQNNASATQVASGGGIYSTGGTNSAISSPGTKQQHAVGGGGTASNKWLKRKNKRL
jgi:hypothetical protein